MGRGAREMAVVGAGALAAMTVAAAPPSPTPVASPTTLPRPRFSPLPADRSLAARARRQRQELDERVRAAEAALAAERARAGRITAALAAQRVALAQRQAPVARLLAALATFARRPALLAMVNPESTDDIVHFRAVLGATLAVVERRTAALRQEVERTRALRASASAAALAIDRGRSQLGTARRDLAALDEDRPGRDADAARALAIGEETRDILDQLSAVGDEQARLADLVRLPGPPVRSTGGGDPAAPYRMPVAGRLVTGFGEVSRNGVSARGLTLAVAPGAPVVAPAAGRVVFARPFRGYGGTVIVDHGAGWTSLLLGVGPMAVRAGGFVAAGAPIGRAATAPDAQVTVELRRRGRPMDLTRLIG